MNARWAVLACSTFLLFSPPASCADLDELFDRSVLHEVALTMSADDWATLRANYQANTKYDATVTIDGETVPDCTIRSRGSGTRNGVKPGPRVDFDGNVDEQRFRGLERLVVDNMYNNPSFLHEQLAFGLFEEMGILVPREAYARLTVNGEPWGLYALIEAIDDVFVEMHVDGGGGNLFEYNAPSPPSPDEVAWDFTLSRGGAIEDYVPEPFEPKTNEDDLDASALLDFIRTVTEEPDATFVEAVSEFVDPYGLLEHYAVEVATAEVDGLTSYFGVNNFYPYQLEGARRFLFIPWDHDFNFTSAGHAIEFGAERNRLIERLLADPGLKSFYRETLREVMRDHVNPVSMTPRIDAMAAQIAEAVAADAKRRGGADNPTTAPPFEDAVAEVREVIAGRVPSVAAQLDFTRRRGARH